ncbi:MAG TPA: hypothetical protein PJ998_07955 [Terrimesophilobacter sp.]|nr:hypothetical protein [Terrimesophilobacter sp.]
MFKHRVLAISAPLVLLTALTGCTPGGGSPAGGGTASGHSDTACIQGKNWDLDVSDDAAQILSYLQSHGSPITSVTGSGSQQIFFHQAGTMGSTTDLTFVMVSPLSSGKTLTMTEHQSGSANSEWAWQGDTNVISFTGWVSNVVVKTTADIDGTQQSVDSPIGQDGGDGADMTVTCSGNTLTTMSAGSPFTMHWTASH